MNSTPYSKLDHDILNINVYSSGVSVNETGTTNTNRNNGGSTVTFH